LLAFVTKAVSVILVPAYVAAIVIFAVLESRAGESGRGMVRRFKFTWWALATATAVGIGGSVVTQGGAVGILGKYSVVAGNVNLLGAVEWFWGNLAALDLYVCVVPLIAWVMVVVHAVGSGSRRDRRLFAAVSVPIIGLVLAVVAMFGSKPVAGAAGFIASTPLRERNFFVVAPLLLIGLALWLDDRHRRGWATYLVCALALGGVAAYPWGSAPTSGGPQNLAVVTWLVLASNHVARAVMVTAWASVCVGLMMFGSWKKMGRVWIAIAAAFVFAGTLSTLVFAYQSNRALRVGTGDDPTWIDRAVHGQSTVAVLWREPGSGFARPLARHRVVWVGEFFNQSVGPVYSIGARMPYALPDRSAHIQGGIVVDAHSTPVKADYVLALCGTGISAPAVAVNVRIHAAVYKTSDKPIRIAATSTRCPRPHEDTG
jgi:hypothetical protein